jgi:hypothetical protein
MNENPYQAPRSRPRRPDVSALRRDLFVVLALDAVLAALSLAYVWFTKYLWTGMASIYVALLLGTLVLLCTAVAGMLIHRPWFGVAGIILFWTGCIGFQALMSLASLADIIANAVIPIAIQLAVFILVWWMAGHSSPIKAE